MPYTNAWDEAAPPGTAAANTLDTIIQNKMKDIRERLEDSLPDWTDDTVDPKRIVVHSGLTDDRPETDEANQGEVYLDIEASQLSFFDGDQWIDFAAHSVRATIDVDDSPTEQSTNEFPIQQILFLRIDGTTDGDGDIVVDLSEIEIGDYSTGILMNRIYVPKAANQTVTEIDFTAGTLTLRVFDTNTGNALATSQVIIEAILVVAGSGSF